MWWLRDSASNQSRARVLDRTRFWRSEETFSFFWSERPFSETTTPDSNHGASEDAPSSEGSWTSEKRDRWDLGHDVRVPQNETKIFTTDTCTLEQNVSRVEQTLPHSTSARHDASTFLPRRARRARFSSSLAVHRGMSCAAAASFHRRTRKSRDSTLGSPNHEEPNLVVPASPASLSHNSPLPPSQWAEYLDLNPEPDELATIAAKNSIFGTCDKAPENAPSKYKHWPGTRRKRLARSFSAVPVEIFF